ncbi:unnamed protein product [Medioppia subpectinata]|uniref:PPM-type phosphatase domain-containing protein n=1 Tax=Medioppia subpectinata TaxID=1979941 RepID=A0A7R9PWN8_9ACAR|nr:unnamed protein product [Medioppia subpectinata]CAG2103940.1 unnamed protein product [Medioppia subpectinata]
MLCVICLLKCPYPLAFALASIVSRKLGLAETSRESQGSDEDCVDYSKPALSSNELYSQSQEYVTEYINSWKLSPELAAEKAKEYSDQTFVSSIFAIKNTRRKMEDRHVVLHDLNKALNLKVSKDYSYYAIFDGHAGVDAANYLSAHLHHTLVKTQAFLDGDITGAFKEAFSITDLDYLQRSARENRKSGSTALCALLENKTKLYIAWLGDSQAVVVRNGQPIDVMIPHKPELEEERKRIEELGGFVAFVDTWRVNGTLAVSRAIGDPEHKPFISSEPDVVGFDISPDTDFLILACDGLWDQLSAEDATSLVYEYVCQHEDYDTQQIAEGVASHLSKVAKDDGSSDNITTIVIFFKDIDQLRATPFKPMSPREKSETNGLNGNHFQYNDSQFEQMLKNGNNPFELSSCGPLSWSSDSSANDMNRARINFSMSEDSIDVKEKNMENELRDDSNPFNASHYVDLNANQNKVDNDLIDTIDNNNESFTREQTDDKQESQTVSNANSNELHSDSQINISKLSDISSSFVTHADVHEEQAFASTPIKTSQSFSYSGDDAAIDTNMSSINFNQDSIPLNQTSEPIVNESNEQKDFVDYSRDSFATAGSEFDMSYSFDKSGYTTAFEKDFEQHLSDSREETPTQTPVKLDDNCDQGFNDGGDEPNYDNNDLSSGAESVDSIVYEKINSDMSEITKRVENDYYSQQNDIALRFESELHLGSDEQKSDILKTDDLLSDAKTIDSNADLIREALLSEHMSAEEAEEVVQQLNVNEEQEESPSQPFNFEEPKPDIIVENQMNFISQQIPEPIETNEPKEIANDIDLVADIHSNATDSHVFNEFLTSATLPERQDSPIVEQISESPLNESPYDFESKIGHELNENPMNGFVSSNPDLISEVLLSERVTHNELEEMAINEEPKNAFYEQNIIQHFEQQVTEEQHMELNSNQFGLGIETNDELMSQNKLESEDTNCTDIDMSLRPESEQQIESEVLLPSEVVPQVFESEVINHFTESEPVSQFIQSEEIPQYIEPEVVEQFTEPELIEEPEQMLTFTQQEVVPNLTEPEPMSLMPEINSSPFEAEQQMIQNDEIEPQVIPMDSELNASLAEDIVSQSLICEPTLEAKESIPEITQESVALTPEVNEPVLDVVPNDSQLVELAPEVKPTETQSPLISTETKPVVKPKDAISAVNKVIKTASKPLASKATTASKPAPKALTKSDPKAKPTASSSSLLSKAPAKATTTTTRPSPSKPSTTSTLKSTAPAKSLLDKKPTTTAAPLRPKATTTTTTRPAVTTAPKTTSAPKPAPKVAPASRPTTTAAPRTATTTSRLTAASKPAESKPLAKPAPTRAPIVSRITPTVASARTTTARPAAATAALKVTPTGRTNGTTASAGPSKSPIKSSTTLKATTITARTATTAAKPAVNGVKASPTKAPVASKPTTSASRLTTSRTAPATKPTSLSSKTSVDKKPIPRSPVGVKPIAVKGENKSSPVPKTNGISGGQTSVASSPSVPNTTSISSKNNNSFKVNPNSLKQELEDAALMSQLTPDSEDNYTSPNIHDNAFIMTNSESLILESSPDVNGN